MKYAIKVTGINKKSKINKRKKRNENTIKALRHIARTSVIARHYTHRQYFTGIESVLTMKINPRNIFNTKILIEDNSLIFKNKHYDISDIISIEKVEEPLLLALNKKHGNPYTKCTLSNTDIIEISSAYDLEINGKKSEYTDFIEELRKKSPNVSSINTGWIPIRIFIPSGIAQIISTFLGFMIFKNFDNAITFAIISAIILLPVGYYWDKKAHINQINKVLLAKRPT